MTIGTERIRSLLIRANSEKELDTIMRDANAPTLDQLFDEHIQRKNITIEAFCDLCCIKYTSLRHKLNRKRPFKKSELIRMAFVLDMSMDSLNTMMKLAGLKELYPRNKEDAIIIYGMSHGLSLGQIDELLEKKKCKLRFPEYRD